jgi:hypothetical protein
VPFLLNHAVPVSSPEIIGGEDVKKDVAATEAARFEDARSYIAKDGRHVLRGQDWLDRKAELMARSGGRCEYYYPTGAEFEDENPRCTAEGAIPSHIIPRYPLRDDRLTNLKHYCIEHDKLTEKQSWRRIRSDRAEHRGAA